MAYRIKGEIAALFARDAPRLQSNVPPLGAEVVGRRRGGREREGGRKGRVV